MGKVVDIKTKEIISNDAKEEEKYIALNPLMALSEAFYSTFSALCQALYIDELQNNKGKRIKPYPEFQRDLIYDIAKQFDLDGGGDDDKQYY